MVKELTREMLWEIGAQFGHQTKRWNPKMKPYIYGEKNKIHIIDLQQTLWRIENVKKFLASLQTKKGKILFVGTKKQAKAAVKEAAERTQNFYVDERWLGGTLTNLSTIHLSVKKLWNIERDEKSGKLALLTKKEQYKIKQKHDKLEKFLGGIKHMRELPQAIFVVDPKQEHIAVKEAKMLRIPIISICDTNVDPDPIDYVIPANDDTKRSISVITNHIADLYAEAMGMQIPPAANRFPTNENKKEGEDTTQANASDKPKTNFVSEEKQPSRTRVFKTEDKASLQKQVKEASEDKTDQTASKEEK